MEDKVRQAYQEKVDARLKELGARIEQLQAKAEYVKADAKVGYYERISELKEKRQNVQAKFQELREAGKDAWQELQGGIDKALADVTEAVERAFSRFQLEDK